MDTRGGSMRCLECGSVEEMMRRRFNADARQCADLWYAALIILRSLVYLTSFFISSLPDNG